MAIFSGEEDKKLPLLTQAYQVDVTSQKELLQLVLNIGYGPSDAHYKTFTAEEFTGLVTFGTQEENPDRISERAANWLETCGVLCNLARRIMNSAFHKGSLSRKLWHELWVVSTFFSASVGSAYLIDSLEEIHNTHDADLIYQWLNRDVPKDSMEDEVPISSGRRVKTTLHSFESNLVNRLIAVIDEIAAGKSPLDKCEECHAVFEVTRSGRRFCSRRCVKKAGQRRRYQASRSTHSLGSNEATKTNVL